MPKGRREVVVGHGGHGATRPRGKATGGAMRDEPRFGPRIGPPVAPRFGLLGPPVLYDADGVVRPVGSGKMRALYVALLLEPGRVVSVEALKDALWGGAPPPSAQASLQNH